MKNSNVYLPAPCMNKFNMKPSLRTFLSNIVDYWLSLQAYLPLNWNFAHLQMSSTCRNYNHKQNHVYHQVITQQNNFHVGIHLFKVVIRLIAMSSWIYSKLTYFRLMFSVYTPWKSQKTSGFLTFSGGYKKVTLAWNGLK